MVDLTKLQRTFNEYELQMIPCKITNTLINYLCKHYECEEFCENWYDSNPFEYEWLKNKNMTEEELEDYRLNNICWQDPYGDGIWDFDQKKTDKLAFKQLKKCKKMNLSQKHKRFWCGQKKEYLWFYWYGRDTDQMVDYSWIFREKSN